MRGQGQGGKVGNRVVEGEASPGTTGGEVREFLGEGAGMGSGEEPGRIIFHYIYNFFVKFVVCFCQGGGQGGQAVVWDLV